MAKNVKALSTFIGTSEEVEQYGGAIPAHLEKVKHKLSAGDKAAFKGKITAGTEFVVSDKRAKELEVNNLVEVLGDAEGEDKEMEQDQGETNKKVGDINVKKVVDSKPGKK